MKEFFVNAHYFHYLNLNIHYSLHYFTGLLFCFYLPINHMVIVSTSLIYRLTILFLFTNHMVIVSTSLFYRLTILFLFTNHMVIVSTSLLYKLATLFYLPVTWSLSNNNNQSMEFSLHFPLIGKLFYTLSLFSRSEEREFFIF